MLFIGVIFVIKLGTTYWYWFKTPHSSPPRIISFTACSPISTPSIILELFSHYLAVTVAKESLCRFSTLKLAIHIRIRLVKLLISIISADLYFKIIHK